MQLESTAGEEALASAEEQVEYEEELTSNAQSSQVCLMITHDVQQVLTLISYTPCCRLAAPIATHVLQLSR